jgi:dihydrofolate reductase
VSPTSPSPGPVKSRVESLEGNARLARDSVPEEVGRLKEQADGDLEVGGAALAADCIELDLVDEYRLFVYPVIVGGDKPFFPSTDASLELELVDTRSFASRVIYLCYQRFGENEAARPTSGALEPCQLERSSISAFAMR